MPDTPIIRVANGIVTELNAAVAAGTFTRTFESKVLWAANRTIALADSESGKLRVDVGPIGWTEQLISRGGPWSYTCRFHVAVRKLFGRKERGESGQISDDEIIGLINLQATLIEFFMPKQPSLSGRKLSDVPEATWRPEKDLTTESIIRWEDLEDPHQFTGYFPLTYQVTV